VPKRPGIVSIKRTTSTRCPSVRRAILRMSRSTHQHVRRQENIARAMVDDIGSGRDGMVHGGRRKLQGARWRPARLDGGEWDGCVDAQCVSVKSIDVSNVDGIITATDAVGGSGSNGRMARGLAPVRVHGFALGVAMNMAMIGHFFR